MLLRNLTASVRLLSKQSAPTISTLLSVYFYPCIPETPYVIIKSIFYIENMDCDSVQIIEIVPLKFYDLHRILYKNML